MGPETFRKNWQSNFLTPLAELIHKYEEEHRLRMTRNRMEVRAPADPGVVIDWLDRFQYYYGVWSSACGLANDIDAIAARRNIDPATSNLDSYAESSLFFFSQLRLGIDRFVVERGGLWLFSDAEVEQLVSDALYQIAWHPPISTLDEGWLLHNLIGTGAAQLVMFQRALNEEVIGRRLLERWKAWLTSCECGETISENCEPHRVVHFAEGVHGHR